MYSLPIGGSDYFLDPCVHKSTENRPPIGPILILLCSFWYSTLRAKTRLKLVAGMELHIFCLFLLCSASHSPEIPVPFDIYNAYGCKVRVGST